MCLAALVIVSLLTAVVGLVISFNISKQPIKTPVGLLLLRDIEKLSQELRSTDKVMANELNRIHQIYFSAHVARICMSSFFFLLAIAYISVYLRHH